jgi:hypothetical protein
VICAFYILHFHESEMQSGVCSFTTNLTRTKGGESDAGQCRMGRAESGIRRLGGRLLDDVSCLRVRTYVLQSKFSDSGTIVRTKILTFVILF